MFKPIPPYTVYAIHGEKDSSNTVSVVGISGRVIRRGKEEGAEEEELKRGKGKEKWREEE